MIIDSSTWTGRPSAVRIDTADEFGLTEADWAKLRREAFIERHIQRFKALVMLWGPAIRSKPRGRKPWTVYDGYDRSRGDDWTFWRAVRATLGIVLCRYHLDRHGPTYHGMDMGHWDLVRGWGDRWWRLELQPYCRVEIEQESGG